MFMTLCCAVYCSVTSGLSTVRRGGRVGQSWSERFELRLIGIKGSHSAMEQSIISAVAEAYIAMSSTPPSVSGVSDDPVAEIAAFLDAHDVMSVATIRPDGWPQATSVGYMARWPAIYFVVARESQKFRNLTRDPRISLCLGAATPSAHGLDGLSMAALAEEVVDTAHIVQFDDTMLKRYPRGRLYNPTSEAMALIRARLQLISVVRINDGRSQSELLRVEDGRLSPACDDQAVTPPPGPALEAAARGEP